MYFNMDVTRVHWSQLCHPLLHRPTLVSEQFSAVLEECSDMPNRPDIHTVMPTYWTSSTRSGPRY